MGDDLDPVIFVIIWTVYSYIRIGGAFSLVRSL